MGRGFSRDIKNAVDEFSFRRIFRRAFVSSRLNVPAAGLPKPHPPTFSSINEDVNSIALCNVR